MAKGISLLKFVGTVSLGLLTGVSYTVSTLVLPTILQLPSSSSASQAFTSLTAALRTPLLALSSLAAAPLFFAFAFSPRASRHPYLLYTSLFAILSAAAPSYLPQPPAPKPRPAAASQKRNRMDASYEVLGDSHSEVSEEEIEDVNGEELRVSVEGAAKAYAARTGLAALGFAMALVGLWGDGAPRVVVSMA